MQLASISSSSYAQESSLQTALNPTTPRRHDIKAGGHLPDAIGLLATAVPLFLSYNCFCDLRHPATFGTDTVWAATVWFACTVPTHCGRYTFLDSLKEV